MSDNGMREEFTTYQTLRVKQSEIWRKVSSIVIGEEGKEDGGKRMK
jgi:hypothetical protein